MHIVRDVNSGLSFLLELAVLVAIGVATASLVTAPPVRRWACTAAAVAVWVVVWALFGAPGATVPAHGVGRVLLEAAWFGSAAAALAWTRHRRWLLVFVIAYAVNTVVRVSTGQV